MISSTERSDIIICAVVTTWLLRIPPSVVLSDSYAQAKILVHCDVASTGSGCLPADTAKVLFLAEERFAANVTATAWPLVYSEQQRLSDSLRHTTSIWSHKGML